MLRFHWTILGSDLLLRSICLLYCRIWVFMLLCRWKHRFDDGNLGSLNCSLYNYLLYNFVCFQFWEGANEDILKREEMAAFEFLGVCWVHLERVNTSNSLFSQAAHCYGQSADVLHFFCNYLCDFYYGAWFMDSSMASVFKKEGIPWMYFCNKVCSCICIIQIHSCNHHVFLDDHNIPDLVFTLLVRLVLPCKRGFQKRRHGDWWIWRKRVRWKGKRISSVN